MLLFSTHRDETSPGRITGHISRRSILMQFSFRWYFSISNNMVLPEIFKPIIFVLVQTRYMFLLKQPFWQVPVVSTVLTFMDYIRVVHQRCKLNICDGLSNCFHLTDKVHCWFSHMSNKIFQGLFIYFHAYVNCRSNQ